MKKLFIAGFVGLIAFASCKKETDTDYATTAIVKPTNPTITFTGQPFYSINTGGAVPAVAATAYDSSLNESYPVSLVGTEAIDNTTPGLYIVQAKATNKYGYYATQTVYVAVTNVKPSTNLAGKYKRVGTTAIANVTKLANGLYATDNLFGSPSLLVTAYFAQTSDTSISFPTQETDLGTLKTGSTSLHLAPGDTSFSYKLLSLTSNDALRTFKKQ